MSGVRLIISDQHAGLVAALRRPPPPPPHGTRSDIPSGRSGTARIPARFTVL
ncbi:transposase [Rhodococcus opacus]|uniref:transposase n=1 Tax=Rhodococcus opacus TaxID=37919 RepID=UPI001F51CCE3|nr:transposase [Rhodococcus opacus]